MNLDELLNRPLNSVADDGFSARVMSRVRTLRRRRLFVTWAGAAACAVLALLFVPWQPVGAELGLVVPRIAGLAALNLAAAAVVLSLLLERQFARL
jgi:hypothetical protein